MIHVHLILSFVAGFSFAVLCCRLCKVSIDGEMGVAWPASMALLGFVAHAVFWALGTSRDKPRHRFLSVSFSVPLKALCGWSLVFGLTNVPLLVFFVALTSILTFGLTMMCTGFSSPLFALSMAAVLFLSPAFTTQHASLHLIGVLCALFTGGLLAVVFSFVESRNWSGGDGFLSVLLLAVCGFVQNVASPTLSPVSFSLWTPCELFVLGGLLYSCRPSFASTHHLSASACGSIVGILWLFKGGYHIFPTSFLGLVGLVLSSAATTVLVLLVVRRSPLGEAESSLKVQPSALFSKKEDGTNGESILRNLLRNPRERKLTVFLLLTVAIMLLEFLYGVSANSLGLISDSFHMMLDGASIAIGLGAAHAASWKPNEKTHPFGFGRYELLGGFVNGVLLLFIAFYVMLESIERIIDPPEIEGPYLLLVSVVGLVVNIIGVVFFHDSHGHSHSHDHGHSGGCTSGKHVDHNMRGVYLHILADLLGSVSVILSSVFIHLFNVWIADPICSALSATLILLSAFPLLEETGKILLLTGPPADDQFPESLRQDLLACGAVSDVELPRMWMHSTAPRELLFCALAAKLRREADYSATRESLIRIVENKVRQELGIDSVNTIVNLE